MIESCFYSAGYEGDGRRCRRTCAEECVHGACSWEPDYRCVCDLGWTGADCGADCGCHGHSRCPEGVGRCQECRDHTTGSHCQFCAEGAFGNATDQDSGCQPCQVSVRGAFFK